MNESKNVKKRKGNYIVNSIVVVVLGALYIPNLPLNEWTSHFIHANIFHLLGNMIFVSILNKDIDTSKLTLRSLFVWLFAYLTASVCWGITANAVGFSGILYFIWGYRLPNDLNIIKEKRTKIKYLSGIVLVMLISLVVPSLSFSMHFFPMLVGALLGKIFQLIDEYKKDMESLNITRKYKDK